MRQLSWVAVAAFAALLVAGGAVSAMTVRDEVEGKVVAFEKDKSVEILPTGADKKTSLKIDDKTEIKGELAVGKSVKVTAKDGVAVKIEVKE